MAYVNQIANEDAGEGKSDEGRGVLGAGMAVLEQLRRPQSAVFAAIETGLIERDFPAALGSLAREFWDFDKKVTFSDILNAGGLPEFASRGIIEFAGDMILDPLFAVPSGFFVKPVKGAFKVAGRVGGTGLKALDKAHIPATKTAQEFSAWASKKFTGSASKEGKAILEGIQPLMGKIKGAGAVLAKQSEGMEKALKKLAKEESKRLGRDVSVDELVQGLNALTETKLPHLEALTFEEVMRLDTGLGVLDDAVLAKGPMPLDKLAHEIASSREVFDPSVVLGGFSEDGFKALKGLAIDRKEMYKFLLAKDQAAGMSTVEYVSERTGYMMHNLNPDARKIMVKEGVLSKGGSHFDHASELQRKFRDVSLLEMNEAGLNGLIEWLPKGMPLFIDNPGVIDAVRAYRTARSVLAIKFMDDAVQQYGVKVVRGEGKGVGKVTTLPKEGIVGAERAVAGEVPKGFVRLKAKPFDDWYMPREAAEIINKHWEYTAGPKSASKLDEVLGSIKSAQAVWKLWTLAPFPEYHARNFIGNIWNAHLGGLWKPHEMGEFYGLSAQLQRLEGLAGFIDDDIAEFMVKGETGKIIKALNGQGSNKSTLGKGVDLLAKGLTKHRAAKLDDVITLGKGKNRVSQTAEEWLQEAHDVGAVSGGLIGGEASLAGKTLDRALSNKGVLGATKEQVLGGQGSLVQKAADIGKGVESNARLSLYLWSRGQGKTVLEAKRWMNKHLFDYINPDPATKALRDYAFPFITWSRYNIPLQLEYLVRDPVKMNAIAKARASIERNFSTDDQVDERYVAEWIRQGMNIRVRKDSESKYQAFLLNNWLPFADLSEVGLTDLEHGLNGMREAGLHQLANMLSPFIKLPIETATNQSFFMDRQFLPEKRRFLGMNLSERKINVLRSLRVFSAMDRILKGAQNKDLGRELLKFFTGVSIKEVDLKKGAQFAHKKFNAKIRELEQASARAKRKGNDAAAEEMREEIQRLREAWAAKQPI